MKSIFITDDHPITRAGLKSLIEEDPELKVCGEASSVKEALSRIKFTHCDLLTLDVTMPGGGGLDMLQEFRKVKPDVKILILTMHSDWTYLQQAFEMNVDGYVLKFKSSDMILDSIHAILNGGKAFPEEFEAVLQKEKGPDYAVFNLLSPREKEIMNFISQGMMNKEIADLLQISIRTVESHRSRIIEKLGVKSSIELIQYSMRFKNLF